MALGDLDSYMKKKNETQQPIYTIHKSTFKVIKDLNISHDTIKILAENIDGKILDISHSDIFADISPRAREIKERINKWDFIKLKTSAQLKKPSSK